MTPAARLSAAIGVLDRVLAGTPAEQALTNWGRASRFAGSGDRHAVRDLVFDALRCRRSFAALGGALTGRGLILGGLRAVGEDPTLLFTGIGHAPPPVTAEDGGAVPDRLVALDCPNWLAPLLQDSLGADFAPVMQALRHRAPLFLRVNTAHASRDDAADRLLAEGIATRPHALSPAALQVVGGARKVHGSAAYLAGVVEVQDVASQAVVQALPLQAGQRVLDYCAGGGGKTLAMAAAAPVTLFAHDADPGRMRDLAVRAARAQVRVQTLSTPDLGAHAPFDLVLCDAPCSGSGAWRRSPEAKWALTAERLWALCNLQSGILDAAAALVGPAGALCYATCSLLEAENGTQADRFLARTPGWHEERRLRLTPLDGGDGFFLAVLRRTGND